jgi:hypothetical protein
MKIKALLLILVLLGAMAMVYPQAAHRRAGHDSTQEIGQTIEQYENQLRIASLKGDASWFQNHLAESYTEIDADGKINSRADVIQAYRTSDLAYDTMNLSEGSARIYNRDSVLLIQKEELAGGLHGKNFSGVFRCSRLWIKQNGEWQLASTQLTRIPG